MVKRILVWVGALVALVKQTGVRYSTSIVRVPGDTAFDETGRASDRTR